MPCETVTIPAPQQQPENGGEDGRGEEQVSREDVTGIFGYAKFRRADDALDAAMMLGLDGIHSHQMNGNDGGGGGGNGGAPDVGSSPQTTPGPSFVRDSSPRRGQAVETTPVVKMGAEYPPMRQ
jgi:hypothetical protein